MKLLLFTLLISFLPVGTNAQSNYTKAMQQGDAAFKIGEYKKAINKYFAAEVFDSSKKEEVKAKVNKAFDTIDALRKKADKLKIEADTARNRASRSAAQATTSLRKAQKMIDAFYFYRNRFALAFKEDQFYFMDKNGDAVDKLGKWTKAEPFDEYTGLAKVLTSVRTPISSGGFVKDEFEKMLDTSGKTIPAAYDIRNIKDGTLALELFNKRLESIPAEVLAQTQLQVLSFQFSYLKSLPEEIGELTNLTSLNISINQLQSLPASISKLKNLKTLNLGLNYLDSLPPEIGELKNLTGLYLSNNHLKNLPAAIGELPNLEYLHLNFNGLSSLPAGIKQLKKLKSLKLQGNTISKEEQQKIKTLLPNCKIEFE